MQETSNGGHRVQPLMQWIPGAPKATSDAFKPPSKQNQRWTRERVEKELLGAWPGDEQYGNDLAASISTPKIGEGIAATLSIPLKRYHT